MAAEYYHLITGPDCAGEVDRVWGIDCGSRGPTVSGRIVSATCVEKAVLLVTVTAPHNHLVACPYSCVRDSTIRCIKKAGSSPCIGARIVPRSRVYMHAATVTAPHDHLISGPNRSVPASRLSARASGNPTICQGVVFSAGVRIRVRTAAKDDHLTACPNRGMIDSRIRRVRNARRNPCVSIWIISSASIGRSDTWNFAAPDNHFATRPDCGVPSSWIRGICQRRRFPSVCCGIVSPARVHDVDAGTIRVPASPDDHLRSHPNYRVSFPTYRRVYRAGRRPRV